MPDARLDNNTLHVSRIFDAPRERVFDAWTTRDLFVQWMCPPGVEITVCEIDVRRGGAWRIDGRSAGRVFSSSGVYLDVVRPERLVFSWAHHADGDFKRPRGHETTVRVELRAVGSRTEVILVHGPFADAGGFDDHQRGWAGTFDKLVAFLGRAA
ncbi:MAG: Activator of Hsp90 ATPase [Reyranella sp.]|nr:Activator of Hsp90 ATPase [Reyranella sp.]